MSYDPNNPPIKASWLYLKAMYGDQLPVFFQGSPATSPMWEYVSGDSALAASATNYFANGYELGMKTGQTIILRQIPQNIITAATVINVEDYAATIEILSESLNASAIGYTYPGGSPRTIQSRLEDYVSILDFGAIGDGVTNNLTAITNAMGAANGRKILVPVDSGGGDYAVTSGSLTLSGVFEYEAGARIFASGSGTVTDVSRFMGFGGGASGQQGGAQGIRGLNVQLRGGNLVPALSTEIDYNYFSVAGDTADGTTGGGSKVSGLLLFHTFGDSNTKGGRHGIYGYLKQLAATNASNLDRNYVGIQGQVMSGTGDGGMPGSEKGAYFGMSSYARLQSGALNTLNVTAGEFDCGIDAGASSLYRMGIQVAMGGAVRGSLVDSGITIYNLPDTTSTVKNGIWIGPLSGATPLLGTDSTAINITNPASIMNGISISCPISGDIIRWTNAGATTRLSPTQLVINNTTAQINIGSLSSASSPVIDFNSSGTNNGYDSRIVGSGGTSTAGNGVLNYAAALHSFSGNMKFGSFTSDASPTVAGYVTITDSSGVSRRLLVG